MTGWVCPDPAGSPGGIGRDAGRRTTGGPPEQQKEGHQDPGCSLVRGLQAQETESDRQGNRDAEQAGQPGTTKVRARPIEALGLEVPGQEQSSRVPVGESEEQGAEQKGQVPEGETPLGGDAQQVLALVVEHKEQGDSQRRARGVGAQPQDPHQGVPDKGPDWHQYR